MTLSFPNRSRSYDSVRRRVRFWGHDSALEIQFFLQEDALRKLARSAPHNEAGFLAAFDERVDTIHEVATRVYTRHRLDAYSLAASDF